MAHTPFRNETRLVTAKDLEQLGIMPKGTAFRMAAINKLPHYVVGCRGRGIRFRVDEVLAALRRPTMDDTQASAASAVQAVENGSVTPCRH